MKFYLTLLGMSISSYQFKIASAYTPPFSSDNDLTLYESGDIITPITTWAKAKAWCELTGGRLATQSEWCSIAGDVYGGQKAGDQWAPITDFANGWIQVGHREAGDVCKTHTELGHGFPEWGIDEDKQPYESNYVLCSTKMLELYSTSTKSTTSVVTTWLEAKEFCELKGTRLAKKAEWCSAGGIGIDAIFGGQKRGDQWAAILDDENEWVQVGNRAEGNECKTHEELGFGFPKWGNEDDKPHWESNYVLCSYRQEHDDVVSDVDLTLYSSEDVVPYITTWGKAKAWCELTGGRLATQSEWCPFGGTRIDAIHGGQKAGDQWAPITDFVNGWIQVGDREAGDECETHNDLGFGYPEWGINEDKPPYESNFVLCAYDQSEV